MISEVITQFVIDEAKAMGKGISWHAIARKISSKWHEDYPITMLERLYLTEKDNPLYNKQKVDDVTVLDLKATVDDMKRKLRDKS